MNHGGMGVIEHLRSTKGLRIHFNSDILQTLSIVDNSTLDGVYYPGRQQHDVEQSTIDFIFSPIPFRFWPKVGRIRVRLLSQPTTIEKFAAFLARNNVSILHSEYSRSGYRFATWNFVVCFGVEIRDHDFNSDKTAYQPTLDALASLTQKIEQYASDLIFEDKDDVRFSDACDIWPITPLAYFYNHSKLSVAQEDKAWIYEHFYAECANNQLKFKPGHRFTAILGNINKDETSSKLNVYADISTTDVMLRLGVIPSKDEWRFSKLSIDYMRYSPPDTSRGFCAHITQSIPSDVKIWKLTNYTRFNTDYCEIGGANLILEDRRAIPSGQETRDNSHMEILDSIKQNKFCIEDGEPFDLQPRIRKFNSTELWHELKQKSNHEQGQTKKYDIFVSYSEKDAHVADHLAEQLSDSDLSFFIAKKNMKNHGGENFSDKIKEGIHASEEMILLCSQDAINSEWVMSEWAAAWILDKRITPILYRINPELLPMRLRALHCIDVHSFQDFVKAAAVRKQLR